MCEQTDCCGLRSDRNLESQLCRGPGARWASSFPEGLRVDGNLLSGTRLHNCCLPRFIIHELLPRYKHRKTRDSTASKDRREHKITPASISIAQHKLVQKPCRLHKHRYELNNLIKVVINPVFRVRCDSARQFKAQTQPFCAILLGPMESGA